jgi:excisionase family DNA binding protein
MRGEVNLRLTDRDIDAIVNKVVERLKPYLGQGHNKDEIFTVISLSAYLGRKPSWIYNKVRENAIPHFKAGKYVQFKKSTIDKWIVLNEKKAA